MYLAIAAFFAWLVGQFFYGDLGINGSREKQLIIAELKANIAALKRSAVEKYAELEKLTRDPGAIRAYALLYGMAGGFTESAPPPKTSAEEEQMLAARAPAIEEKLAAPKPFFARHPILIVLLTAICLGTGALTLQQRRRTQRKQYEQYELTKTRVPRVS